MGGINSPTKRTDVLQFKKSYMWVCEGGSVCVGMRAVPGFILPVSASSGRWGRHMNFIWPGSHCGCSPVNIVQRTVALML